ncbi:hypothetical protein PHLCEN_2v13105 [Hermanssonia centrifuga]|uniref:Uncharacterized protein n=1 Tax=Hermanssonia centrifuga TaxID=98765 RepID=A0A2R6NFA7_9APHY|nr:hypothetical protein PHLCEN_2v13105 [Hermanssonia centrifuga]
MPNLTLVTIDDSDSRLIYRGNWFTNRSSGEYMPTVHGTQDVGASVKFSFNGTRVQVFGTADDSHASANFTLDGGAPTQYQQIPSSPSAYHTVLYNSPLLDDSEHTLVITSTAKNATLWLDYLRLAASTIPSTIPSSISAGLSPNSPQDYQPLSSLSPAQAKNLDARASTASEPTSPSQPMEPALIALIVLGSVLSLMVIAAGIILWCRCGGRQLRKSRTLKERGFDLLPAGDYT